MGTVQLVCEPTLKQWSHFSLSLLQACMRMFLKRQKEVGYETPKKLKKVMKMLKIKQSFKMSGYTICLQGFFFITNCIFSLLQQIFLHHMF